MNAGPLAYHGARRLESQERAGFRRIDTQERVDAVEHAFGDAAGDRTRGRLAAAKDFFRPQRYARGLAGAAIAGSDKFMLRGGMPHTAAAALAADNFNRQQGRRAE